MCECGDKGDEMRIEMTANGPTEKRVLDYLEANASVGLVEKLNAGKKSLGGAVIFATAEAQKMAKGSGCVCVNDATVFGWIVHFFEEDEIKEPKKGAAMKRARIAGKAKPKKKAPAEKASTGAMILELFSSDEMRGTK